MKRRLGFGLIVAAGVVLVAGPVVAGTYDVDALSTAVALVFYLAVGGLIIARRDGHLTGWLLASSGVAIVFVEGIVHQPWADPTTADWVASWGWTAVFSIFAALTLTFPSGHPPRGPTWQARLARISLVALPVLTFVVATTENLGGPEVANAIENPVGFLPSALGYPGLVTVILIFLAGTISLIVRRRRSTGTERAQLTWVVFALVLFAVTVTATIAYVFGSMVAGRGDPGDGPWIGAFALMLLFPFSFGVAVLRYRLFDIDRILSRTVSYVLILSLLALTYFGGITLLSTVFSTGNNLSVAVSTLAVAVLFNPLRRRAQLWVDRRFNRSHYDARRIGDDSSRPIGTRPTRTGSSTVGSTW